MISISIKNHEMEMWQLFCFQVREPANFFYLKASPLPPALWQLRVSWLLAWCLANILIGLVVASLLGFCCLVFALLVRSIAVCESFWMLLSMSFVWHWLLPRYQYRCSSCQLRTVIGLMACCVVDFLLSGFCLVKFLCWNVCWLAGFWVFVLEAFYVRNRKMQSF